MTDNFFLIFVIAQTSILLGILLVAILNTIIVGLFCKTNSYLVNSILGRRIND